MKQYTTFFMLLVLSATFSFLLSGCKTVPTADYSFKPVVAEWITKPYKEKIVDYGIKDITTFVTAYNKEDNLFPGVEAYDHYDRFDKDGNNTVEIFYFNSQKYYDRKYEYAYNKENIRVDQELYFLPREEKQNMVFKFDKKGNLIEQFKFGRNGKIESSMTCRYNLNGKLIEKTNYIGKYDVEDKFIYEYDSKGNNTAIKYFNAENVIQSYKTMKYDTANNVIFEAVYDNNNVEQFNFKYLYDEDNIVDSAIYYSPATGIINYQFMKDEDGNMQFITGYNSRGHIFKMYRFEYTYFYSRDRFAANSTFTAVSNYEFEGSLTAGYIQSSSVYFPVKNLKSDNIDCEMIWNESGGGGIKRIKGKVRIIPRRKGGKDVSSSIIMDYSGSMKGNDRTNIQKAADMFINRMSNTDEAQISKFNTSLYIKTDFTSNKYTLSNAINDRSDYSLEGGTALFDAINSGVDNVKYKDSREFIRCVIVLTDGGENSSVNKDKEYLIQNAVGDGVPVYTIGYGIEDEQNKCYGHYDPPSKSGNLCEWTLWDIATRTGGFYFYAPKNSSDINDVYNSISGQIGNTFDLIIDFPPDHIPPGGTNVTVKLSVKYRKNIEVIERSYIIR